MKKYKLALLGLAAASAASAQTSAITETSAEGYFSRGLMMFESKNYTGCIDQLGEAKRLAPPASLYEDADYYIALSKYKRGDADCVDALAKFLADYPASLHRFNANFAIGNYYFDRGKYGDASRYYNRVDDDAMVGEDFSDLVYRKAFCNLRLANFEKAQRGFDKLKGDKKYREASGFYDAYIKYSNGEYSPAEQGFKKIQRNSKLYNEAQYYICQIRFEDEDYSSALSIGNRLLPEDFPADMKAELYRVVGESEYHSGNNDRAVDMLKKYVDNCQDTPKRSSMYILGVAEYRNANYDEAVKHLDAVVDGDDALAQSAYLYIGQAYLQSGNMNAASIAFEKAYKMDFDRDVQETAFYNFAIAQSRGGKVPFSNSVQIFEDFLNKFPKSKYASGVEDYIINSYMASRDYDNALATISKIESPSAKMMKAKQNVLYRLGVRELTDGNTKEAIRYLNRANQIANYDKATAAETSLWLGEAYYRNGEYAKSASNYKAFINNSSKSASNRSLGNYGLGYAYFQQKDYGAASNAFKAAAAGNMDSALKSDAYNRIGDCLYYSRDYSGAETYYDRATQESGSHADYALYQKGFMRGLQRRHSEKIAIMDQVVDEYPQSSYAPKAIYEKAQAYIALGKNSEAETAFNSLMRKYPQSGDARQGQLQLAMLLNSTGNRSEARNQYRSLISKFPSSEEAKVAEEDLKVMYAADNNLGEFARFMKSVDSSYQIDENEMDRLSFESAESEYVAGDGTKRLKSYLKSYPNGRYAGQAAYYLAEDAYKARRTDDAIEYSTKALALGPDAGYAETALAIQGELLLKKGEVAKARNAYEKLREKATNDNNRRTATIGLMRISKDAGIESAVIDYADELLAGGGLTKDQQAEVRYSRAVALKASGNESKAAEDLKSLSGDMQSLYGAMAAVELSEIYYKDGKLDSAEKLLNKLIDSGTPHQYWMARGFILLSDVYKKRGDKFQAREYLESLKDNYPGKEADIFEMIDTRLKALKK